MRRSICLAIANISFLSSLSFSAAAADGAVVVPSTKKVTVYATRSPQSTFDVPVMTSIVETDAAGNALANDMADLLEFVPSVEVTGGPRRNGQYITIRGFDDESIITLIDGRRQNYEAAHDGRFFVDPSLLKSVEIVKGASSAIYGGGAIGGVVAFETKDASDLLAPGESRGVLTSFNFRSATDEYVPSATGYMRSGNWDLLGNISFRHADDIELGADNALGIDELIAKDHVLSGLFKAGYTWNDLHTFKFLYQTQRNDGTEPNNGQAEITTSNPLVDKEVEDDQFSFKYAYDDPSNNWLKPKLHVYFNDTSVEELNIVGSNIGRIVSREMETLGVTLDNQSFFNTGNVKHILSYGFEYYNNQQEGNNSFTTIAGGIPNAEADNYGFYLQDEITLDTDIGEFLVIPALRFDSFESDDEFGNSQDDNQFSPKIAASYLPNDNLMLFASWAEAFRAPNLTELYAAGQHFPGVSFCPAPIPGCPPVPLVVVFPTNFFVPNPNLRPETVTTFEIGGGVTFEGLLADNDFFEAKGSWHHSDGEDFITQSVNLAAGTTTNSNVVDAELEGWEADIRYLINGWSLYAGLSHVTATDERTGEFLPNSIPHTLVTDIGYSPLGTRSTIGARGRFAEEYDEVPTGTLPQSGYGVFDLYYRWQKGKTGKDNLVIDLGIENITDKAYSRAFFGLPEEGRSYVARAAYQW